MRTWWNDRRKLKRAREVCQGGGKWLRIHRDLLSSGQILDVTTALRELERALKTGAPAEAASRADEVERKIGKVLPPSGNAGLRENVEVLLVAAIVAMGVRTFFLQPFKIPTGSMQPTLYGVYPPPGTSPTSYSKPPSILDRLIGTVLLGRIYEGAGYRTRGDFIFVDKISYHFCRPRRGDVVVFTTADIREMSPEARGKFYIKRLIGLANDVLRIAPPHVLVGDHILDSRAAFQRIYSQRDGYHGYVNQPPYSTLPRYLNHPETTYQVPDDHFFVLGDNSTSSSDGRYWGSVPEQNLVGRAILVYWPFSRRIGLIE